MRRLNFALISCLLASVGARAQIIHTFAGGGPGSGIPATSANLNAPDGVARDAAGNLYIGAINEHKVFKVDPSGTLFVLAGIGVPGFAGDGGPATSATLNQPRGVALGPDGSLYIADSGNNVIRKVSPTGTITTVAGKGYYGFAGDGGPATAAYLAFPVRVAVANDGTIYIGDQNNQRVRKVNPSGTISTFAGNGSYCYPSTASCGDGGPAGNASLAAPAGVAIGLDGSLYIADQGSNRIRKVNPNGTITTIAGNGNYGYSGDGGPATSASLYGPAGVAVGPDGSLYIADTQDQRIRKVSLAGVILTVAGTGAYGFNGDSIAATSASLASPTGLTVGSDGSLFILDLGDERVRKVDLTGIISTVAGNGSATFGGDGGLATGASLYYPHDMAVDASGNLYVADTFNHRIRKVDATTHVISTVAGTGGYGYNGDNIPATSATLYYPESVTLDTHNNLYIVDSGNERLRKVDAATGVISTVAGGYFCWGSCGDGGPATGAGLYNPWGVALDALGNIYISDAGNNRIRKVDANTHIISNFAGMAFTYGFSGDGGLATNAMMGNTFGIVFDRAGNLYIADRDNQRIRKVDAATGIISTVAGGYACYGSCGDGGLATSAGLDFPWGLALDLSGNLYISELFNQRIRKMDATTGIITTVAGNGTYGFSGDGGLATSAMLAYPIGVAVDSVGNLYITDYGNHRIRKVDAGPVLNLSSAMLDFGHVQVGSQSLAQSVTVTNSGGGSLSISGVSASGDYLESDNCTPSPIAAGGSCTANVSFLPTATGTRTGTLTINANAPGSPHTVSLTGIGDDTTPPVLSLPANITKEGTGPSGAVAIFTATATDNVDGSVAVTCAPASGSTFALGTTTVNCSAIDKSNNTANGSFTVTVQDTTPPVIAGTPSNMTIEATGPTGAVASWTTPTATDLVDGSVPVVCSPASGSTFPIATTTVSCSATDAHGNKTTTSFTVKAQDTTPPALTLPSPITAEATGPSGAIVNYTATANDLVDGALTPSCSLASGSTFSIATTTVACSATDAHGNKATTNFTVKVQDTTPPTISCGAPDGLWHASDVSISCTASDAVGLANPADANFSLTTSVTSGTETASAANDPHTVCDKYNNCATAGPIAGNKVDKKGPSISINVPTGGPYTLNQAVAASYSCTDGGSGLASCSGTAASSSNINTSTVGSQSFTVTAKDSVGNTTTKTVSYTVLYATGGVCDGDVGHSILQPINADGSSVFKLGSTVPTKFRVCDANGVSVGTSGVVTSYQLVAAGASTGLTVDESIYSNTPDLYFRWDAAALQWIFNQATGKTTNLSQAGTIYVLRIYLNDGTSLQFQYGLK